MDPISFFTEEEMLKSHMSEHSFLRPWDMLYLLRHLRKIHVNNAKAAQQVRSIVYEQAAHEFVALQCNTTEFR